MRSFLAAWRDLDTPRDKARFYRMWHVGRTAGLLPDRIFATMDGFEAAPVVQRLRDALLDGAKRRDALETTIGRHPDIVAPFERALLELGEESGQLDDVLDRLSRHFEIEHQRALRIRNKLTYPMINAAAAVVIVPAPLLIFGSALRYAVTVVVELTLVSMVGGTLLDALVGMIANREQYVVGRFCRALVTAIESGMSIDRAARLAARAAHPALARHVARFSDRALSTQPLSVTFAGAPILPSTFLPALKVAETSGDFEGAVGKLADLYDGPDPAHWRRQRV